MKKTALVVALALLLALVVAAPASAITYGQLDGNTHPNVCAILAEYDGVVQVIGSGTLIAPDIVVTASHVTAFIESMDEAAYVSFDPTPDVHPETWIDCTMHTNPAYNHRSSDPDDVAVVVLDTPQTTTTPAALPSAGLLTRLGAKHGLAGQTFTCVGYGSLPPTLGGGKPAVTYDATRRFSVSRFTALTPAWLYLSQNPALGWGGTGYGDSGGAIFKGSSMTLAGVTVKGDPMLRSTNIAYRLDTRAARAFLGQFVTLPK